MGSTGVATPTGGRSAFVDPSREFSFALYGAGISDVTTQLKNAGIDSQIQFKRLGYTRVYTKISASKWRREDGQEYTNRSLSSLIVSSYKTFRGTVGAFYDEYLKVRFI